jgi:hypothetical protein
MGASVLLMLLVIVQAVVRAMRRTGQLTGELDKDRRKVLRLLGSLPLGVLVGVDPLPEELGIKRFARPIVLRIEQPVQARVGGKLISIRERVHQPFYDSLLKSSVFSYAVLNPMLATQLRDGPLFPEKKS